MAKRSRLNWKGKAVAANVARATIAGLNETAGACVRHAKSNHSGWENVTGLAEGSIQVSRPASSSSEGAMVEWGSVAVVYMRRLEFEHGSALRSAAQVEYPKLASRIKGRI